MGTAKLVKLFSRDSLELTLWSQSIRRTAGIVLETTAWYSILLAFEATVAANRAEGPLLYRRGGLGDGMAFDNIKLVLGKKFAVRFCGMRCGIMLIRPMNQVWHSTSGEATVGVAGDGVTEC